MTWADFNRLAKRAQILQEYEWARTREIIAIIYNVNRGQYVSAKSGADLIPLTIDNLRPEIEPLTLEEHKEILKRFGIN